ncbi:MAG: hypothetical protein COA36_12835 [Desulfotalea sp.]|nr:MAG: hypothetical protein COA36_12835 [Desulfotalea sp.]
MSHQPKKSENIIKRAQKNGLFDINRKSLQNTAEWRLPRRFYPDHEEELLWLFTGIGSQWKSLLGQLRFKALDEAIRSRDDKISSTAIGHWTDAYCEFEDGAKSSYQRWMKTKGILHACLVQPYDKSADPKPESSSFIKDKSHALQLLLEIFEKPLKKIECDKVTYVNQSKKDQSEKTFNIRFPSWASNNSHSGSEENKEIKFRIWTLSDLTSNVDDFCAKILNKQREWEDSSSRDPYFFLLIDTPEQYKQTNVDGDLNQLYTRFIKDAETSSKLRRLRGSMSFISGLAGLEGLVAVRKISNRCLSEIQIGGKDDWWGGAAWLAWLVTLYQRAEAEKLAINSAKLIQLIIKKKENPKKILEKIETFLKQTIFIEATWMYREFAKRTDVDQVYRIFQEIYDLDEIWEDMCQQTKTIVSLSEAQHARQQLDHETQRTQNMHKLNTNQTILGMVVGAAILITGVFGMNIKQIGSDLSLFDWRAGRYVSIIVVGTLIGIIYYCYHLAKIEKNAGTLFIYSYVKRLIYPILLLFICVFHVIPSIWPFLTVVMKRWLLSFLTI